MLNKRVILDTNVLVSGVLWRMDIFSEIEKAVDFPYQLCILQGTVYELGKIQQQQRGKFKAAVILALALLKAKKVKVLKEIGGVDELLAKHSYAGDLVVTQDQALKRMLQKPYLTLRQKKMVVMVR